MNQHLKPCPFCGGSDADVELDEFNCLSVACHKCKAFGPPVYVGHLAYDEHESEEQIARDRWNERSVLD